MINLFKTTKDHSKYWRERHINWNDHYTATWTHPHRQTIIDKLKTWKWVSVIEVGCASGPNLIRIIKEFPRADVGGVDINPDAVATARQVFAEIFKGSIRSAWFKVNSADNIGISDDATDIVLSDMSLIYVGRKDIKKTLLEMKRITRNRIMLMEFHNTSWWKRLVFKLKTGYNAYSYKELLDELGFHNITVEKLPPELWDNHEPQKTMAHLVTAQK